MSDSGRDVVVIGASAGGVEALRRVIAALPQDLPAAVFIVLHVPKNATSVLPDILSRAGLVHVEHARDGQRFQHGRVYVAPPDTHMLLKPESIRLSGGPTENGHRPSIDALFRSAAASHGARVIGVVLSGALDDGAAGLLAVSRAGGITMVQDPTDALYQGMPESALAAVPVDVIGTAETIGSLIGTSARLVPHGGSASGTDGDDRDVLESIALGDDGAEPFGTPSRIACPACGGPLWHDSEHAPPYRCRIGHAFTEAALLAEQDDALERALRTAVRILSERRELTRKLRDRAVESGRVHAQRLFDSELEAIDRNLANVRRAVGDEAPVPNGDDVPAAVAEATNGNAASVAGPRTTD